MSNISRISAILPLLQSQRTANWNRCPDLLCLFALVKRLGTGFQVGQVFEGSLSTAVSAFSTAHTQRQVSEHYFFLPLEMYWATPEMQFYVMQWCGTALCRQFRGLVIQTSVKRQGYFIKCSLLPLRYHQNWKFYMTSAPGMLVFSGSMVHWCTRELRFHSQSKCHELITKSFGFPYVCRTKMLPCIWLYP